MADLSALDNAIAAGPYPLRDDASRLVSELLRAHYGEGLAAVPDVKFKPQYGPVYMGHEGAQESKLQADGLYDYGTKTVTLRAPDNASYKPGLQDGAAGQLETADVMKMFDAAVHELHHARAHVARGNPKRFSGDDWGVIQQAVAAQGINKKQLLDAAADIMTSPGFESAKYSTNPETILEEFLAYVESSKGNRNKNVFTPENEVISKEADALALRHPWLGRLISDWTRPELHSKRRQK